MTAAPSEGVNHGARAGIADARPRPAAYGSGLVVDDRRDFREQLGRELGTRFQQVAAVPDGLAVAQDFLRLRITLVLVPTHRLVKLVVCGDDVFDFGRASGFLQHDGAQKHGLIGDEPADSLQIRQRCASGNRELEHSLGLHLRPRRQRRQVVIGLVLRERHVYMIPASRTKCDSLCT